MKPVTADEIKKVEKILLPDGKTFGNEECERVKVIKELEKSCHVVACPGSGKTTVLLAKLMILADRMPFEDNRGICVLTHTNVAIDEIKKKAGTTGDKLFKYPNFFGTFQRFVDKYLAKPAYIQKFGMPFNSIDIDIVTKKVKSKYYKQLRKDYKKTNWIFYRINNKLPKTFPEGQKTKVIEKQKFDYFNKIAFDFHDEKVLYKADITQTKYLAKSESTDTYKFIHSIKYPILEEGYLYYDDAFSLGLWYISQNKKILKKAFLNRFKYVFVDEMQDTDRHQLKIIEELFENTDTIIQYYGDPNQSIYDFSVKGENVWEPEKDDKIILSISDSKRFGNKISCVLDKLKIDCNIQLQSNSDNNTLKPKLLIFKKDEEKQVLEKFTELIYDNKHLWMQDLNAKEPVYKAIGWVAKERTDKEKRERKLNISSYFPGFEKKSVKNKQVYDNLKYYLSKNNEIAKEKGAKIYYDSIINAFLEVLYRGGVRRKVITQKQTDGNKPQNTQERHYTKTSFFEELEKMNKLKPLLRRIAYWSRKIQVSSEKYNSHVIKSIKRYIKNMLPKIFENINESEVNEFIKEPQESLNENCSNPNEAKGYIFKSENAEYNDISIEVGTVHSVKGESHTATLYMETSYQAKNNMLGHESERIADFLINSKCCLQENRAYHINTLKMVHVGFSRPTHLLCFAVCENRIDKDKIDESEWEVVNV